MITRIKIFSILFLLYFFWGCSLFFNKRTFEDEIYRDTEGFFIPSDDFIIIGGDQGDVGRDNQQILERTPLDPRERVKYLEENSLKKELLILVNSLTEREYKHYIQYQEKLESISEKIYFLRLENLKDRNWYLKIRGHLLDNGISENWTREESAAQQGILVLGMSKDQVVKSLGRPERIDVSGEPYFENERWLFDDKGKASFVYFEEGKVKGWERQ